MLRFFVIAGFVGLIFLPMYFMIRFVNCCCSNFNSDSKSKLQLCKNCSRQYS